MTMSKKVYRHFEDFPTFSSWLVTLDESKVDHYESETNEHNLVTHDQQIEMVHNRLAKVLLQLSKTKMV